MKMPTKYSPPTCGGYRVSGANKFNREEYSPRSRGFSDGVERQFNIIWLHSPACGGYQALRMICTGTGAYSPRIRGLSDARTGNEVIFQYSPRVRGLSAKTATFIKTSVVFPPHAGVIGGIELAAHGQNRIPPRVRGLSGSLH